ncbi:hypothetical protein D3C75_323360 [compost metagenome]
MINIEMLSSGQCTERHKTFDIRSKRRIAAALLVRAAEHRCRNDLTRLCSNALEGNLLRCTVC